MKPELHLQIALWPSNIEAIIPYISGSKVLLKAVLADDLEDQESNAVREAELLVREAYRRFREKVAKGEI